MPGCIFRLRFRPAALLLTGLALLVGCGQSAEQKLLGTWQAELDRPGGEGRADADAAAAIADAMVEGMDVTLAFGPASNLEMHMALGPMTVRLEGDWAILSDQGDTALLEILARYPQSDETKTRRGTVTFLDADTVAFVPGDSERGGGDPLSQELKLVRRSP